MKKISYLAGLVSLLCNPVTAVELGSLTARSHLNEPFRAVLDIRNATDLEWSDIRFKMASARMYERFGMQPPSNLQAIQFRMTAAENGDYQVHLSSRDRVVEPILNILIEVEEKEGSFYREYTLLMDPAEFRAPVVTKAGLAPVAQPPAPRQPQQAATAAEKNRAESGQKTILVKNRSISIIAQESQWHPQYSVYQIMRAMYLANPAAFEKGNINKLMSGTRLVVPDEAIIAAVPRQKAINFVYSVSKDRADGATVEKVTLIDEPQPGAVVEPVMRPAEPAEPVEEEVIRQAAGKIPEAIATDLGSWRSMTEEFSSLSGVVDRHNRVLRTQAEAIQAIYHDLDTQQQSIARLTTRLDDLQGLAVSNPAGGKASRPAPLPLEEAPAESPLHHQQREIDRLNSLLRLRDEQLRELNLRVSGIEQQPVIGANELIIEDEAKPLVGPVPPAAPIITHTPAEPPSSSLRWWLSGLLLAGLVLGAVMMRNRHRRHPGEASEAEAAPKPTTYSPSHNPDDSGAMELKQIEARQRRDSRAQTVTRSALRLESDSPEEVKVEIEVLLAYEQYEEALSLLQLSEEKFGEAPWIDFKRLEILAATSQCEEFLRLFTQKRVQLESFSPVLWDRASKLRDRLCADFRMSVVS